MLNQYVTCRCGQSIPFNAWQDMEFCPWCEHDFDYERMFRPQVGFWMVSATSIGVSFAVRLFKPAQQDVLTFALITLFCAATALTLARLSVYFVMRAKGVLPSRRSRYSEWLAYASALLVFVVAISFFGPAST